MDPDLLRIALRAILAAWVAEIPDQFLFLGVDRDHRLLFRQSRGHLGVDVAKLRIPVGMAIALRGLAVALQAVARIVEQSGDQGAAHRVAPARRPPPEGSSPANSFSPRPIVLGAIPVAIATAAIPP